MGAAHKTGLPTHCRVLNLEDSATDRLFLMDVDSQFRAIPHGSNILIGTLAEGPRATNRTIIPTFSHRFLFLDLGLDHAFRRVFIVHEAPCFLVA